MGLDTSHGCWSGAYSAFSRWRTKLAEVAGFPPLLLMEHFFDEKEWWFMTRRPDVENPKMYKTSEPECGFSFAIEQAFKTLPIPWGHFESDPLTVLLNHSDCDGTIPASHCGPLADRLAGLIDKLPDDDGGGHIGNWREKTQQFVDGLRAAAAAGEDVEFH